MEKPQDCFLEGRGGSCMNAHRWHCGNWADPHHMDRRTAGQTQHWQTHSMDSRHSGSDLKPCEVMCSLIRKWKAKEVVLQVRVKANDLLELQMKGMAVAFSAYGHKLESKSQSRHLQQSDLVPFTPSSLSLGVFISKVGENNKHLPYRNSIGLTCT